MVLVTAIPFAGSLSFQNVVSASSSLPVKRRCILRWLGDGYLGITVGNGNDDAGMIMARHIDHDNTGLVKLIHGYMGCFDEPRMRIRLIQGYCNLLCHQGCSATP